MSDQATCHVEVVYPQALIPEHRYRNEGKEVSACPWIGTYRAGNDGKRWDVRPGKITADGEETREETFAFDTRDGAQQFVEYTAEQFNEWPDTCQGKAYVIRVLKDDQQTELSNIEGTFGSQKPT